MADEILLKVLRGQAWERAKGELHAMLATFFGLQGAREGQFDALDLAVEEFIDKVESEGLME